MRITRSTGAFTVAIRAAVIAVLAIFTLACGEGDEEASDTSVAGETTAPGEDGTTTPPDDGGATPDGDQDTVIISPRDEINNPDLMRRSSLEEIAILTNIFGGHVIRQDDGTVEPGFIESWESNDESTVWTLHVRDGVTFHNGDPMTAEDVAWSIERAASIGEAVSGYWDDVESAEATDDQTVELTLTRSNPLRMRSGELAVQPKDYFEEVGEQAFEESPVGAGPYKFVEWTPGDRLVLEAFDDYWEGEPEIENVIFRNIPDDTARAAALQAGDIDVAVNLTMEAFQELQESEEFVAEASYGALRTYLVLDNTRPPFDDVNMRKAVNHGIDWDLVIEEALEGFASRTPAIAIPEEFIFNPDLEPYEYDPDLARELVADAGHSDGVDVEFTVRGGILRVDDVAAAIQAQLSEIGIRPQIQNVEAGEYGPLSAEHQIGEMAITGFVGDGTFIGHSWYAQRAVCDAPSISATHGGYYCNDEEIVPLLNEMFEYFQLDPDRAQQAGQEMERIAYEDAAMGWGYQNPRFYGIHPDLDWSPSPIDYLLFDEASWR